MNRTMLVRTVVLGALVSVALSAYADTKRPPLPPGSARVKVEPGQSKEEKRRMQRAHRAPSDHEKDYTHDDTAGTDEIAAPPLPRGSARVRIEPGQSPEETRRILRAHRVPRKDKRKSNPSSPSGNPS
jgi:hypothetical protein